MRTKIVSAIALTALIGLAVFNPVDSSNSSTPGLQTFDSPEEFRELVESGSSHNSLTGADTLERTTEQSSLSHNADTADSGPELSRTNIQVEGVREPDILKNTGHKMYYSDYRNTTIFNTSSAENFSVEENLSQNGEMLRSDDSLFFLGNGIKAVNRDNHEEEWSIELNSSYIESARMYNDSIYVVVRESAGTCPVRPMDGVTVDCGSIYYPGGSSSADTTYTLLKISEDGEVEEKTGFVGSRSNTIVYMSQNNIYLTYYEQESRNEVMQDFIEGEGQELFDQETRDRFDEIFGYELSYQALQTEIQTTIRNYVNSLPEGEQEEFREDLEQGFGNYTSERKRELSSTGIARFNLDLELEAEGEVPGEVNDQFSIDENEDKLRMTTTVGNSWRFNSKTENDLYVLNNDLEVEDSVKGMGLNERIYSTRFVGDKAYIVTFRRVDPFHVVDLSGEPELTGELKLPGFSSYLHPLGNDTILGIGEENNSVKMVAFDVSGDEPEIKDEEILEDRYSAVSSNHHAFMIDRRNEVFFLPASTGGYIYSYSDGLEQVKKVDIQNPERAAYVDETMYVFSDYNATAVDMNDWSTVKEIQFKEKGYSFPTPILESR